LFIGQASYEINCVTKIVTWPNSCQVSGGIEASRNNKKCVILEANRWKWGLAKKSSKYVH